MKKTNINQWFALWVFTLLCATGCTVHYVADYDLTAKNEIIEVAKEIDVFWGALLDTKVNDREYDKFKNQYNQIEADIRSLVMRNEVRALNLETTKQAQIALALWVDDRENHKTQNGFSDFEAKRHREQYNRVFTAMAKGEQAKNIATTGSSK